MEDTGTQVAESVEGAEEIETQTQDQEENDQAAQSADPVDKGQAVKDAAKEVMRKYKVKVSGEEIEVDEDELKRGYSHQRAATKVMQEAQRMRQQAEKFVSMMKDKGSLFEAIQKLGHDPRQLAEEYLAAQLEDELLDPKDKELKATKARLRELEEMDKKQQEALKQKRDEALKKKYAEDYNKQFVEALKETQLPPTKECVADMARYVYRAAEIGLKITPLEAAKLVKEDIENKVKKVISESDGDTLVRLLGEDVANKIRAWDTSRVKDPNKDLRNPASPASDFKRQSSSPQRRMSHAEWRDFNRK